MFGIKDATMVSAVVFIKDLDCLTWEKLLLVFRSWEPSGLLFNLHIFFYPSKRSKNAQNCFFLLQCWGVCQGSAKAGGSVGTSGISRPGARRPGLTHFHSQGQPRASGTILGTGTGQVALLSVALRQGRAVAGWRGPGQVGEPQGRVGAYRPSGLWHGHCLRRMTAKEKPTCFCWEKLKFLFNKYM